MASVDKELIKHLTAGVFVLNDQAPSKVLLHRHRKLNVWMQPGGHVNVWENPLEAAIRETEEEVGIDVSHFLPTMSALDDHVDIIPTPAYVLEEKIPEHGEEPEHYHIDLLYVAHIPEQAARGGENESQDVAWFTLEQLKDLQMFDNIRIIVKQELLK